MYTSGSLFKNEQCTYGSHLRSGELYPVNLQSINVDEGRSRIFLGLSYILLGDLDLHMSLAPYGLNVSLGPRGKFAPHEQGSHHSGIE